ncbi:MAG: IS110 family transposase, partial [Bacteroidales bacterium]|nr:IS110 family transposase [Bacteroidales bacterium]
MIAIGIDIGKGKHAAAVVDGLGKPLCNSAFYENNREGAEKLLAALATVAPPSDDTRIGMEATGGYWFAFHDFLVKAGYRVDVINPIVTSASISGDIRGRKTDKGDALAIARVLLRDETLPRRNTDTASRRLMALTRHRSFLVEQRSGMKRHLQSTLDVAFPEFHTFFEDPSSTFAMQLLHAYPSARALSRAKRPAVAKLVAKYTRGKDANEEAERLVKAARDSLAAESDVSDTVGACVRSSVECIFGMDAQIEKVEADIQEFEMPELGKIISKIKGSGKLLPKVIAAEFGDISRFEKDPKTGKSSGMHKRLLAYAGAEARVRESGKWKGQTHMSKRGSGALRTALMQISFTIS